MEFQAFPKLPRLNRNMVITEKLDGTNACVVIEDIPVGEAIPSNLAEFPLENGVLRVIGAQSRKRLITPEQDNYGFARWVQEHAPELVLLGPGHHYGEWWGNGIQRGYGLDEKRFSLFNTSRWSQVGHTNPDAKAEAPECCHVVPVLAAHAFSQERIKTELDLLREHGSYAAPGFMNPEGIVVYLAAARQMFKVTLENDEMPKSAVAA